MRTDDRVIHDLDFQVTEMQAAVPPPARKSKLKAVLLALVVTILNALGNTALAVGMKRLPQVGLNPVDYVTSMLNPFVAGGIVLLILWLLTRMTLLSWADLTFALPLMALGYVVAPLIGCFFLHEHVNAAQWAGTLLIVAGCGLVGTTTPQTTQKQGDAQ